MLTNEELLCILFKWDQYFVTIEHIYNYLLFIMQEDVSC